MTKPGPKALAAIRAAMVGMCNTARKFDERVQESIRGNDFSEDTTIGIMYTDMMLKLMGDRMVDVPEGLVDEDLVTDLSVILNLCHSSSIAFAKKARSMAKDPEAFQERTATVVAGLCMADPRLTELAIREAERVFKPTT